MALKKHVKHFFIVIYLHCVHPVSAGGLNLLTNFQKRRPDRILIFRGRLPEKRGEFSQEGEGLQFFHKK